MSCDRVDKSVILAFLDPSPGSSLAGLSSEFKAFVVGALSFDIDLAVDVVLIIYQEFAPSFGLQQRAVQLNTTLNFENLQIFTKNWKIF